MLTLDDLRKSPNLLARHYTRFRVSDRLLLTGHSHQAWPDRAFEGQREAIDDAAEHLDEKWERAFEKAERVRLGFSRLLDDDSGAIALGGSTHELVVRFLSALPLRERPRLITTDGEFHTLRRQLDRLSEEGIEVVKIPSDPAEGIAASTIRRLTDRTAAVLVSAVLFRNARIVPGLADLCAACTKRGVKLLVDAYHALNAIPFSLAREGLKAAFVVGGGYKYCQLGEGNCFLRYPEDCGLRPVVTGWFSEFDDLARKAKDGFVAYGRGPLLFAGSTYDPTSHYRACEVLDFFEELNLTPAFLRRVSQHQIGLLIRLFDAMDANPALLSRNKEVPLESIGGFLALRSPHANEICGRLRAAGVRADSRDDLLRLGPAPYLSDDQLKDSISCLALVLSSWGH